MEAQRRASERRKLQVLQALTILNEVTGEEADDVLKKAANPEKFAEELENTLKERASTMKLKVNLRHVDPETAIAQLKEESARKLNPAAALKRKRRTEPVEPSRRSTRVSGAPARYSYADLLDDDDDESPRKRGKRRRTETDEEWSGRQRSSQLSRGELKPYVKRENTFGPIEDTPVGMWWQTRMECSRDGVHRPTVSGIHGGPNGVYSIALSGGYAENEDFGEYFWFTGEGGRDLKGTKANPKNLRTAPQTKDQTWTRGNFALYQSIESGTPVRVVRGFSKNKNYTSPYAPETGYRYDGLYKVVEFKVDNGITGFNVFRFKFERLQDQEPLKLD